MATLVEQLAGISVATSSPTQAAPQAEVLALMIRHEQLLATRQHDHASANYQHLVNLEEENRTLSRELARLRALTGSPPLVQRSFTA